MKNIRILSECVKDGEPIKHTIKSKNKDQRKTWIVTYKKNNDTLVCGDSLYHSLHQFSVNNYKNYRPDRTSENNSWTECKLYRNNEWISMYNLPDL